ncbi:Hsp70 family protein [Massilia sp. W12]|uniref:Hsp70 family protein n=1 Tax=Massilia sp. W12 TaxID=3126507 RepID=UPI0030CABFEA
MSGARYSIGIDLGTTHCALAWVDLASSDGEQAVQGVLSVPQLSSAGNVQALPLLPSFLYLPHESEFAPGDLSMPWQSANNNPPAFAGEFARTRGAGTPIRLVSSAKSWLCHAGVERRGAILPEQAPPEVTRISPLEASTRYLQHLQAAWNHAYPQAPFAEQHITITIPASFDPAARELTLEAAQLAGYPSLTLLEEPQAALYSWIQNNSAADDANWRKQVKPGDVLLVIDVGGGTSDFSLIAVTEQDGNLELQRIAVGEHILLGGDNMDLTLAHVVARKIAQNGGAQLDAWQMRALTLACRSAKEALLSDAALESAPLLIPSRGSKLIGGSIRSELTRAEVTQIILEGFFPQVGAEARPQTRPRIGLTQIGLPYAHDPGVTRHLAALLARQAQATDALNGFAAGGADFLRPSAILFNGGVFKGEVLAQRCLDTINGWLQAAGAAPARRLQGADLDLAVARGAAYYGYVKRGKGVRIRGGTAQAFYIGIESNMPAIPGFEPPLQALCVAPFGMEEGHALDLPGEELGLVVGEPVTFRFFASSVRRTDAIGALLEGPDADALEELPPLQLALPAGENAGAGQVVAVRLQALASEAGTLELAAVARDGQRWNIAFNLRQ